MAILFQHCHQLFVCIRMVVKGEPLGMEISGLKESVGNKKRRSGNMMRLENKVAIITGGGIGTGKETALFIC